MSATASPRRLLIEACRISEGGGLVLLRYLLSLLARRSDLHATVVVGPHVEVSAYAPAVTVITAAMNLANRRSVYRRLLRDHEPETLLCFGNFPPPYPLPQIRVVTYFHRPTLLTPDRGSHTFKYRALNSYLRLLAGNTDAFFVQTEYIHRKLAREVSRPRSDIRRYPFFEPTEAPAPSVTRNRRTSPGHPPSFLYVSSDTPHKNHERLLVAWQILAAAERFPRLVLTVDETSHLYPAVASLRELGCEIELLGFVSHGEILRHTADADFGIFPSLQESLGLGLIEAASLGLPLLCADLAYTYEVVDPSLTFDPYDPSSIAEAVAAAMTTSPLAPTHCVIGDLSARMLDDLAN